MTPIPHLHLPSMKEERDPRTLETMRMILRKKRRDLRTREKSSSLMLCMLLIVIPRERNLQPPSGRKKHPHTQATLNPIACLLQRKEGNNTSWKLMMSNLILEISTSTNHFLTRWGMFLCMRMKHLVLKGNIAILQIGLHIRVCKHNTTSHSRHTAPTQMTSIAYNILIFYVFDGNLRIFIQALCLTHLVRF